MVRGTAETEIFPSHLTLNTQDSCIIRHNDIGAGEEYLIEIKN